jgi:hypothetical protein
VRLDHLLSKSNLKTIRLVITHSSYLFFVLELRLEVIVLINIETRTGPVAQMVRAHA